MELCTALHKIVILYLPEIYHLIKSIESGLSRKPQKGHKKEFLTMLLGPLHNRKLTFL